MRKWAKAWNIGWFGMSFLLAPALVWAYVSLTAYTNGEVLTHTKLNANQNALNTGLDNLQTEMKDSVTAVHNSIRDSLFLHMSQFDDSMDTYGFLLPGTFGDSLAVKLFKAAFKDSAANYGLAATTTVSAISTVANAALPKADFNDSLNTRQHTTIPLPWAWAFADSMAANDSLTVEISRSTPLGDAQSLFIKNAAAKPEKVRLTIDGFLHNPLAKLDSIHTQVWTETAGADSCFAAFYVQDDSTMVNWKAATDSTGQKYSATARTTISVSQAISTNSIVGGRFRVTSIFQLNPSDSMFVGPIEAVVTNR